MSYKHGIYGAIIPSQSQSIGSIGTIPIYIGTAPVHRLADYSKSINVPMVITSLEDAKLKLGYNSSDNFKDFTLSAVIYAHFENRIQSIGPIIVINVLDPEVHMIADDASVVLTNGVGYISEYVNLSSIEIADKIKGTNYTAEYTSDGSVCIKSINNGLNSPVTVTFDKIDPTKVTDSDVIGVYDSTTGERTGLSCIEIVYEKLNVVPTLISAPGFNQNKAIRNALISACTNISGRWEAIAVTDMDCAETTTIDETIAWKTTNSYINTREKTCWLKGKVGTKALWLSIITIVRMMLTDYSNNNVPYESPSNKQIDVDALVFEDGTEVNLNLTQANKLNEKGITTGLYFGGRWVLWGPHMSNYEYGITTKPEEMFDVNIRTNLYLLNDFNLRNAYLVDTPIVRNDIDEILNTEQLRLNSLVAEGKILYGEISFNSSDNQAGDLIQGDFTFSTQVTNTPPGKSLTNKVQYSTAGLSKLQGGDN